MQLWGGPLALEGTWSLGRRALKENQMVVELKENANSLCSHPGNTLQSLGQPVTTEPERFLWRGRKMTVTGSSRRASREMRGATQLGLPIQAPTRCAAYDAPHQSRPQLMYLEHGLPGHHEQRSQALQAQPLVWPWHTQGHWQQVSHCHSSGEAHPQAFQQREHAFWPSLCHLKLISQSRDDNSGLTTEQGLPSSPFSAGLGQRFYWQLSFCWTGLNQSAVSLEVAQRTPTFRDSLQVGSWALSESKFRGIEKRVGWGAGANGEVLEKVLEPQFKKTQLPTSRLA